MFSKLNKISSEFWGFLTQRWWIINHSILQTKKNCFNQKLAQHIGKNFKFPKEYKAEDKGTKVIVTFIINEEGKPEIKEVTGGKPYLQEEAKRNILQIPEMKPGMLGGKPRAIQYKVPFNF